MCFPVVSSMKRSLFLSLALALLFRRALAAAGHKTRHYLRDTLNAKQICACRSFRILLMKQRRAQPLTKSNGK
jgi:hypothetical protein